YVSKLQMGWLIYDFGRRENRVSSARSGYRIATLQEQAFVVSLLQQLVRRYYSVSLAWLRLEVTDEALKSAQARLEQARERVQQGMVVQSDLLSAEVFVASRTQENIEARHQHLLALAGLQEILGNTEAANFNTADLKEKQFAEYDLASWREELNAHRAELKIVKEVQQLAGDQVASERSDFLPSLQAWSAYEWHGTSLSYSGENWGAGLELRWNLFRGFSDALQFSAAKLMQKSAQEKLRETENALWLQLQTGYYGYQSAKEKWKVAVAAVQHASENRRIYAERYASGLVTIQDSLQAETAYKEARLMLSQNIYEMYVAYADLLAAAGKVEELKNL
ncbi:MAG TPA: TolC family protein, partial [Acidobacteriota bacterium]